MIFATLRDQNRDGRLVLISQDRNHYTELSDLVPTLQKALESWKSLEGALQSRSRDLEMAKVASKNLNPSDVLAPLPRSYQWLDASAYVNHVELVRKSRGVEMPASFWTDPLMYQGASDYFMAPTEDIRLPDLEMGIDFEAEIAVITDDVPMGVSEEVASKHIKLIVLVNDVSLRNMAMQELQKGFGFLQSKPASTMSPFALTPDELGEYWKDSKLHLPLRSYLNEKLFGEPNAGVDMVFNFSKLISHAARTRFLSAGTVIGSGTVSNRDRSKGSSCIVEKRTLEILESGKAQCPYMQWNDRIRIEMLDINGKNLFGSINQKLVKYG